MNKKIKHLWGTGIHENIFQDFFGHAKTIFQVPWLVLALNNICTNVLNPDPVGYEIFAWIQNPDPAKMKEQVQNLI